MRVIGYMVRARYQFLQRYDEDQLAPLVAELRPETRALFEAGPIETRWYPVDQFYDLIETADRVLGRGDLALVEDMGAFAASNITGYLRRLVFKFGNPRFGVAVAPRAWSAQFEAGKAYSKSTGPNSGELRLVGVPGGIRPSLVAGIRGWLGKAVELFGSELVSIESYMDKPEPGDVVFTCEWR